MSTYISKRPDGSTFELEWEAVSASMATIQKYEGMFCRFCLENGKGGVGAIVDGVCSKGCKESMVWLKENASKIQKKVSVVEEKTIQVDVAELNYEADPKAKKYFDDNSRVMVMFSELCKAGPKGLMISEVCTRLQDLFKADEKSVKQDVSTKCSKWGNKESNKHHNDWWLLQDGKPSKGRPKAGETKDRRLFLVFQGQEIPAEAFIPEDKKGIPQWLISQIEKS